MIIPEDSPLRRRPEGMEARQALFFDGIRFAIETADFAHQRLRKTLLSLAGNTASDLPMHAETPAAIADAWSIVDAVHRLRALIRQVPGLVRRQHWPSLRGFEDQTGPIEDLRNTAQHLSTEIQAIADAQWPIWGVLNWFVVDESRDGGQICTLVPGRIAPGVGPILNPGARSIPERELPLGLITLTTHRSEICLSDTMEHIRRVASELENSMRAQHGDNIPTSGSDILTIVSIDFLEGEAKGHN